MRLIIKLIPACAAAAFIMVAVTHASAQSDTMGRNKNAVIERGTAYPQNTDSLSNNMLTPGKLDTNVMNKSTVPDSTYKNKSNRDSSYLKSRSGQPVIKDTLHSTSPVSPDKTKATVKPSVPPKNAGNPEQVKSAKNKTMYLVPDSTLKKDTLK